MNCYGGMIVRRPMWSAEVGGLPVLGVVAESQPDGVVDGDVVELGGVDEPDLGGLVADGDGAAGDAAEVGDVELLADLAVGVGDDVGGVGVDAEQPGQLDVQAGFFLDFADDALPGFMIFDILVPLFCWSRAWNL